MLRANLLTYWLEPNGNDKSRRPHAAYVYPFEACSDDTAQQVANLPTTPNAVILLVDVHESVMDQIIQDPNYGPGSILWSEVIDNE